MAAKVGQSSWCFVSGVCGDAWSLNCVANTSKYGRNNESTAAHGKNKAPAEWHINCKWHLPGKDPLGSIILQHSTIYSGYKGNRFVSK